MNRIRPTLRRIPSPAEEARRTADATSDKFVTAFDALLIDRGIPSDHPVVVELDRLYAQLRADEYEAGHATGYAQHPGNRKDAR